MRYTHFHNTTHARLDRIYISVEALRHAHCYRVQPISFTDHSLVSVSIGRKERKPSRFNWQLWKLNRTLLDDEQFVEAVRELLRTLSERQTAQCEVWEGFKEDVKLAAIERASDITFQSRPEERHLKENLEALCRVE